MNYFGEDDDKTHSKLRPISIQLALGPNDYNIQRYRRPFNYIIYYYSYTSVDRVFNLQSNI